jgi:hypothetical protein
MTVPAVAALRVLWALGVGAFLGLCYDFLRPLRHRYHWPSDLLFLVVSFMAWIWYSFQICRGDIRLGGTLALGMGIFLWLGTASMAVRKVFYWFWLAIFQILAVLTLPFAKIFTKMRILIKKVFASGKKRGTIERAIKTRRNQDE